MRRINQNVSSLPGVSYTVHGSILVILCRETEPTECVNMYLETYVKELAHTTVEVW